MKSKTDKMEGPDAPGMVYKMFIKPQKFNTLYELFDKIVKAAFVLRYEI